MEPRLRDLKGHEPFRRSSTGRSPYAVREPSTNFHGM